MVEGEKVSREEKLERIVRETLWMARRYADGRSTYAPTIVNECIDIALELGIEIDVPIDPIYAEDGMFGEWDTQSKTFKKVMKEADRRDDE